MPSVYNGTKIIKQSEMMPCPFCNQQQFSMYDNGEEGADLRWFINCNYCLASGPCATTKEGALKAWEHNREGL
jgi:hypothetical protein